MARGITEQQVHAAADALVAAGERPTVERIRQHLGTGSPNTVTRWLETWWGSLGTRLAAQARKVALPEAPEPVQVLASQLWEQALACAREFAEDTLAQHRRALEEDRKTINAAITQAQEEAEAARTTAAEAAVALAGANERLADRHALVQQQADQIADFVLQRDSASRRAEQQEADTAALRVRLEQVQLKASAAQETQAAHARQVEDRAHAEVDRARQSAQELQRQLQVAEDKQSTRIRQLEDEVQELRSTEAELSRQLSAAHATRDALKAQVTDLRHSLRGALQTTLQPKKTLEGNRVPKTARGRRQTKKTPSGISRNPT